MWFITKSGVSGFHFKDQQESEETVGMSKVI